MEDAPLLGPGQGDLDGPSAVPEAGDGDAAVTVEDKSVCSGRLQSTHMWIIDTSEPRSKPSRSNATSADPDGHDGPAGPSQQMADLLRQPLVGDG
jgi:hypothetical protein